MSKLKSRKFWITVVSAILLVLNQGLGLNLDTASILSVAGLVLGYIFAEAHVDGKIASAPSTPVEAPAQPVLYQPVVVPEASEATPPDTQNLGF